MRAAVDSSWAEKVVVPRSQLLKRGKFIQGEIQSVTVDKVTLADGTELTFDYLVCATGAFSISVGEPNLDLKTKSEMIQSFKNSVAALQKANKVAIIGGGSVAVELAGEIRHKYPNKSITLIHSGKTVMVELPEKAQKKIHEKLAKKNIQCVLNVKADLDFQEFSSTGFLVGDRVIKTTGDATVDADIVYCCTGTRVNSSFYPEEWLDGNKRIKVSETFQLAGHPNVFAVGDVCNSKNLKMGYTAQLHAGIVSKNVLLSSKGNKSLKVFKPSDTVIMIVPIGSNDGVTVLPFGTFGSTTTKMIKAKSLFVGQTWKANNQKLK